MLRFQKHPDTSGRGLNCTYRTVYILSFSVICNSQYISLPSSSANWAQPHCRIIVLKGHSQLQDLADRDASFYLNQKSEVRVKMRVNLAYCFIRSSIEILPETCSWVFSYSSYNSVLLYLVKNVMSIAYLVICKLANKWYLMHRCIARLCSFNFFVFVGFSRLVPIYLGNKLQGVP